MYALVQFLDDKGKAIVPVKSVKNFDYSNCLESAFRHVYEVFWNLNGEGSRYWNAVVLFVADTIEEIEQWKKGVKVQSPKKLEELLALTENQKNVDCKETCQENREMQEKQSACDKDPRNSILRRRRYCRKRPRGANCRRKMGNMEKGPEIHKDLSSKNDIYDDKMVPNSELEKKSAEYEKVLCQMKEMQEKQSACDKDQHNSILRRRRYRRKRSRLRGAKYRMRMGNMEKGPEIHKDLSSKSDISDNKLVPNSELEKKSAEYEKVLCQLKLKEEVNLELMKKNNQLLELNVSLQSQLLSLLNGNGFLRLNLPESGFNKFSKKTLMNKETPMEIPNEIPQLSEPALASMKVEAVENGL